MNAMNSSYSALPTLSSELPSDLLEMRAAEQRRRLHNTVTELRSAVRERMDLKKTAAEHVWPLAGAAAAIGLILGYTTGGIFVR